jgi:hypothetical protein
MFNGGCQGPNWALEPKGKNLPLIEGWNLHFLRLLAYFPYFEKIKVGL